jgi:hypothetical protein
MRGNPHVRFGPGAAGKGPATTAGTSPVAYRCNARPGSRRHPRRPPPGLAGQVHNQAETSPPGRRAEPPTRVATAAAQTPANTRPPEGNRTSMAAVTSTDPPTAATAGSGPDTSLQSFLLGAGHHHTVGEERGLRGMPRHAVDEADPLVLAVRHWQQTHPVPPFPPECLGQAYTPPAEPPLSPRERYTARRRLHGRAER